MATATPLVSDPALPWIERFRPVYLNDIAGNKETVERLKIIAQQSNMTNIILSGTPGIGKTTSILCLARELLDGAYREAALELNASDDRGIGVVRNRIKMFAQKKVAPPPRADSVTLGAQQALRHTMEIYSNTTRFALACNMSSKIIEPIQSRCAMLRFDRLSDEEMTKRLLEICKQEEVPHSPDGIEALIFSAEGDMRQAINNLQSTYYGFGYVSADHVFKVCDQPHPAVVSRILLSCQQGDIDVAVRGVSDLWDQGYSSIDIVTTLFRVAKLSNELEEYTKLEYIKEIGLTHMRVLDGVQTLLQLSGLMARLCQLGSAAKPS
ncbi:P-loop containing nucleoside triphosphate hydrolase protein [Syncephalis pseudoplumigaleata]|uniref:Replication factor C subunit 4 n=1 Tax=Syncephalis pseudoplumigaleata TaxID=1712513 RepID=A0A4P9YSI9_9FUNG|nr:P-loop containing nucleoside triphosphate hydrolase protein [Syncephalis pseudoplumigaleata]|eukprot:RKP22322.1 P-loop containing nucleoside triphosphate hydrolase protein [Syncephalis pseudoplumigaleata]